MLLRKRIHAPQSASELEQSLQCDEEEGADTALTKEPTAKKAKCESMAYRLVTVARTTKPEPCIECSTCSTTIPLSRIGLSKAPAQWRWRCNSCVVWSNQADQEDRYVPPMLPRLHEPEE